MYDSYFYWTTVKEVLLFYLSQFSLLNFCVFCEVEEMFIFLCYPLDSGAFINKAVFLHPTHQVIAVILCHLLGRSVFRPSIFFHWLVCPCAWVTLFSLSGFIINFHNPGIDHPLRSSSRLSCLFLASMCLPESINQFPQKYFLNIWLGLYWI